MKIETICLRGQDARRFLRWKTCGLCRKPAREWARMHSLERMEAHATFNREGNMLGFLCPKCAAGLREAMEKLGVAGEGGHNGEAQGI